MSDWVKSYTDVAENPPANGSILTTVDGSPAELTLEFQEGAPPFIYGRLYVPEIIGEKLGWFLHGPGEGGTRGWKCVLLPMARVELIKKLKPTEGTIVVKSLRMIRPSRSGGALLCEVHEYASDSSVPTPEPAGDQVDDSGDEGGSGGETPDLLLS